MIKKRHYDRLFIAAANKTKERNYWLKKLSGNPVKTTFPYDINNNKNINKYNPGKIKFKISGKHFSNLMNLSCGNDRTLHVILTAGLVVMLKKYTCIQDIILGTPIYKQDIEGVFTNTVLILRNRVNVTMTFKELLLLVRDTMIEAVENQSYPIEILLEQLNIHYSEKEFPLFDVAILLRNIHDKSYLNHIKINMTFSFLRTGDCLDCECEYNSLLFEKTNIKRITHYYMNLIKVITFNLNLPISSIDILSVDEKRQILFDFNNTRVSYPEDKAIAELFETQVEKTPDLLALVYGDKKLTYRELDEKTDRVALILRSKGIKPNNIVGIMVERSLEMMVGILGILKAGGAYLPVDSEYPEGRIKYMLSESRTDILLTQNDLISKYVKIGFEGTIINVSDSELFTVEKTKVENKTSSKDLAYLTYTSGSTGKPKGVMISNRSIANLIKGITGIIDFKERCSILSITTISFDIFILETILPLTKGLRVVIGSREEQLNTALAASLLEREKITMLQATPSWLQLLLSESESARSLQFLEYLLIGGEVFPESLLEKAKKATGGKIYNLYGPTETTVWSTVKDVTSGKTSLNIGKPISNTKIYILSRTGSLHPIRIPGELCIAGDGLARGYLNRPELTFERFAKNPFFENESLYKTGDLAIWQTDGTIEFLGRIDNQVKLRGFRIELGEIERRLLTHNEIREAVVVLKEEEGRDKYLCAYIVSDRKFKISELREYLLKELPDYIVPSYFVQLTEIPLTINGKVDRKSLPPPEVGKGEEYEAPRDEIEETLVEIWSEVLGIKKDKIGIGANFFELGGHSLKATIMISKIHKELNIVLPLEKVFRTPFIMELSKYIKVSKEDKYISIEAVEKKAYYVLSYAQKRLYLYQQMELESKAYNITKIVVLQGILEIGRLKEVFKRLINRHESLRTSFKIVEGEPVQKIHEEVDFAIEYFKGRGMWDEDIVQEFVKPFDLSEAPLFRIGIIENPDGKNMLLIDMHHIITDGISQEILTREFTALYLGEDLQPLRLQHKDFTAWHNNQIDNTLLKEESYDFWKRKLEEGIPEFELPVDFKARIDDGKGAVFRCVLNREIAKNLEKFAEENNTTLFIVMFAAYNILLSYLSNQENVVCGVIASGREHIDLHNIVGFFVNLVITKNRIDSEEEFSEFLGRVEKTTLEALQHQTYPIEQVLEDLELRYPKISTAFNMVNIGNTLSEIELDAYDAYHIDGHGANFDIEPYIHEYKNGIEVFWRYKKAMFKPETIEYFANTYMELLDEISCD